VSNVGTDVGMFELMESAPRGNMSLGILCNGLPVPDSEEADEEME